MRGMALVVVLVMIVVTTIMGIGLHMYSLSTRFQVARASYSTAAEYLCEAACEEGFFMAQQAMNDPNYADEDLRPLYQMVRTPAAGGFRTDYRPVRLLRRLQQKEYDGISADFPASGVHAEVEFEFTPPFSNLPTCAAEYGGILTFRASVRPVWTSGKTAYRQVIVRRSFKVVFITPPHPFDKSALTLVHPDYINGPSKAAIDADIFQPTNQGIDAHNQVCDLYKNTIKTAKKCITCPSCKQLTYISGSPPFIAPHIPESAKIPSDFFFDDSVLIGTTDRDDFGKLKDFNYEDILRKLWPPLFATFSSLLTVAQANGALLVVTTALLAVINDAMEALPYVGQVIAAIHKILKVIVPIQIIAGQALLAAMKVVMEGLIVGQLFYQLDQALQGNFQPMADGAATFGVDMAQSGIFNQVDSANTELDGMSQSTDGNEVVDGVMTQGEDGSVTLNEDALASTSDSISNNPMDFEGKFDGMKDLENMDGSQIRGLGDQLTQMFGSNASTSSVGPLSGIAADSDMSMLTGIIKGFIDSHRKFYTLEFPAGTAGYTFLRQSFGAFDHEPWLAKATFYAGTQHQVTDLFERYRSRGLCGVLHYGGSDPLEIQASRFKGKFIVYSVAPVTVAKAELDDDKRDSLTIITPGSITLGSSKIEASLNAVGEQDSYIVFGNSPELFGNVMLGHYRVDDQRDHESNDRALKGQLKLNKRLDQREKDGTTIKPSHLRVLVSPGILSHEVVMTP